MTVRAVIDCCMVIREGSKVVMSAIWGSDRVCFPFDGPNY